MPGNLMHGGVSGLSGRFSDASLRFQRHSAGNVILWDVKRLLHLRASLFHAYLGGRCVLGSGRRRAELLIVRKPRGLAFTGCRYQVLSGNNHYKTSPGLDDVPPTVALSNYHQRACLAFSKPPF